MKPPYIKVIYTHLSGSGQKVVYVADDGKETDISNVIESAEITIASSDIARFTLKGPFVVTYTEDSRV